MTQYIRIKGAKENNLKNIHINIPKKEINAFVGVSGSGKSSLVFDIIAKESQRQLNDTFSSYIQSRLPHYKKPKVDQIENLSPAIVINQKRLGDNQRSSVGTATDIYSIMRLFFSRFGSPFVGFSDVFSFNNPNGMCPTCQGLGYSNQFHLDQLFNKEKSLNEGAILFPSFQVGGYRWKRYVDSGLFDNDKPLKNFTKKEWDVFLYAENIKPADPNSGWYDSSIYDGVIPRIQKTFLSGNSISKQQKLAVDTFITKETCPSCKGMRLNKKVLSCKVHSLNISECTQMDIEELIHFLKQLPRGEGKELIDTMLLQLHYLLRIGLGYLSLDRNTASLSGGESQRVKMVKQIGSSLSDMLYIFDEPSIGLHPHDIEPICGIIKEIHKKENTLLLIDHDIDMLRIASHVFELGPQAGIYGGKLVYEGSFQHWNKQNLGLQYKRSPHQITSFYPLDPITKNNLFQVHTKLPQHGLIALSGVAGSGKSSFAQGIAAQYAKKTNYIDQKSLTTNRRSTIASYIGVFDEIRKRFAKANNVEASLFSFNGKGKCKTCKGKGFIELEVAFMGTIQSHCEACDGTKYHKDILNYTYRGKTIVDVLQLSVIEAIDFYSDFTILSSLATIGLSYIAIGQTMDTLSGGELQRVKLALSLRSDADIIILDEPTTGLSNRDVDKLSQYFDMLLSEGKTIIMIEHNIDMIESADWIIDFGPKAGKHGGTILYSGPLSGIHNCEASITRRYLKKSS